MPTEFDPNAAIQSAAGRQLKQVLMQIIATTKNAVRSAAKVGVCLKGFRNELCLLGRCETCKKIQGRDSGCFCD